MMECRICGASINGNVTEMIAWSERHDAEFPGPGRKP